MAFAVAAFAVSHRILGDYAWLCSRCPAFGHAAPVSPYDQAKRYVRGCAGLSASRAMIRHSFEGGAYRQQGLFCDDFAGSNARDFAQNGICLFWWNLTLSI
jgi:alkyl sulfatase BDS1-like metallo-beta-lactamase superfamily hydrolase